MKLKEYLSKLSSQEILQLSRNLTNLYIYNNLLAKYYRKKRKFIVERNQEMVNQIIDYNAKEIDSDVILEIRRVMPKLDQKEVVYCKDGEVYTPLFFDLDNWLNASIPNNFSLRDCAVVLNEVFFFSIGEEREKELMELTESLSKPRNEEDYIPAEEVFEHMRKIIDGKE